VRRQAILSHAAAATLALACAAPARAADHGPGDSGIVNVSSSPGAGEGEQPLAADPLDPCRLTTVANVFEPNTPPPLSPYFGKGGIQDNRLFTSQDCGRHWTTRKLDVGGIGPLATPLPPLAGFAPEFDDAFNIVNTDADSIWDRHGNAYYESGDIHGIHHNGNETATVWRSTDGGGTWGPRDGYTAVNATEEHNELDRPWFAVDNSGGAHDGRLYMTFETTPFAEEPPEVYVKHSDDHGQTWSPTVRVDDGLYETQFNARNRPVVGADGTLYVVYDRAPFTVTPFTAQAGRIGLVVARSVDGGQTFEGVPVDGDVHRVDSPDEATPQYLEMIPAIAADPAHAGRVAVAWPEAVGTNSSRIMLRSSSDGGVHWSPRVDVADDDPRRPDEHDHVTLAWYRDGRLFVGWRDRRCCGGGFDDPYEQRVRVLDPGRAGRLVPGRTLVYTDAPEQPNSAGRGVLEPDEFQGLVATSRGVALTWSMLNEKTGGLDDLMFRMVPLAAYSPRAARARRCGSRRRRGRCRARGR